MKIIKTQADLLDFIRDELSNNQTLSIRGVARLCGVNDMAIIRSAEFASKKLAEKLTPQGFDAAELTQNGFPAKAVWLTVEYFAFESKAKAEYAKQIARTFGMLGILQLFEELTKEKEAEVAPPPRRMPPVRDVIEYTEAFAMLQTFNDPIAKSYLTQMFYEEVKCNMLPPSQEVVEHIPASVRARELGYNLAAGEDAKLGKFVARHLTPAGKVQHGRYPINVYECGEALDEVIHAYYR